MADFAGVPSDAKKGKPAGGAVYMYETRLITCVKFCVVACVATIRSLPVSRGLAVCRSQQRERQ